MKKCLPILLLCVLLVGCGVKGAPVTRIACLGDSLTEGDYGTDVHGVSDVRREGYPYFLSALFDCPVANYGKCGYTANMYLDYFESGAADVSDADAVLLMLGTNDGLTLKDESNRDSYKALIAALRQQMKPDALLILLTPPHATENPDAVNYGYAPAVENSRAEVLAMAAEENLPVIDAYANSPIQPENEALYQNVDGLHLNRAGYEAFAKYLAEELRGISHRFPKP